METAELAAMAVAVMTATATGAAGAVGQGAGTAVADVLRARLAATDRGRVALNTLHHAAEDPAAQDMARSAVREEIEADADLRRQLQLHLTAPGAGATGSLLITGSRVSRSPIAFGPLTVNNTRGGRMTIALVVASLLALVAMAVYGGVELFVVDDSPESSQGDGARHAVRALNVSEVKQVVPDLTSMPSGWSRSGSVAAGTDNGCSAAQARFATNNWNDGSTRTVWAEFTVWSCSSQALTAKGFEELRANVADNDKATEISFPELGDQRAAITHYNVDLDETTADAQFRVGTVLARVEYHPVPDAPEWNAEFEQLATMVAARAQQTQNA
ncbi:hypothetical protein [Streptomyces sp. NPDC059786]|uniref:hypothetical protein n=1 Tax=Streptomyces sp. NPDC059786 TaxID=3346946 RepID=UPI003663310B